MSEFDDVIEKGRKPPESERDSDEKKGVKKSAENQETPRISLSSLLEEEPLLSDLTETINPELKTQVLIPLLNIVEKYGFADNIISSERTQNSLALVGVLTDVAPVLKGLSDYLEGHRNSLNESDKEFLDQLKDLESNDDLEGLFNSENEIVVETAKTQHPLLGELPEVEINQGVINWMDILDPEGKFSGNPAAAQTATEELEDIVGLTQKKEGRPIIKLPSIEDLAAEAGVDLEASSEPTPLPIPQVVESESEITPVNIDEFLEVEETQEVEFINNQEREIPIVSFDIPLNPTPVVNNPPQEDNIHTEEE